MKNPKKTLRNQADKLFYQRCLEINPDCLLCGKKAQQIHHFKPKSHYGHLRYELLNGISLCMRCHFLLTHSDSSLQAEIADKMGAKWYNKIQQLAKDRKESFITVKWYQEQIEKLKGR